MNYEAEEQAESSFQEQCRKEIEEMRRISQSILDRTPQRAESHGHWSVVHWLFEEPERTFDSRTDPKMVLLTRAASQSQIAPILEINEWRWATTITLFGKNPNNEKDVRIMEISMPTDSVEPFATTVVMCQDMYISRIPYCIFSESFRSTLVTDVVIPSLRTVDNYLGIKASW